MSQTAFKETQPDFVQARHLHNIIRVPIENITHFQADSKYVVAYHTGGQLLLDTPLVELERVYGQHFIRAHHNALVSRDRLSSFRKPDIRLGVLATVMVTGATQPVNVSRRHIPAIRNAVLATR